MSNNVQNWLRISLTDRCNNPDRHSCSKPKFELSISSRIDVNTLSTRRPVPLFGGKLHQAGRWITPHFSTQGKCPNNDITRNNLKNGIEYSYHAVLQSSNDSYRSPAKTLKNNRGIIRNCRSITYFWLVVFLEYLLIGWITMCWYRINSRNI